MNASVRYALGRLVLTGVLVCSSGLSGCDKRGPPEILDAGADGSVERVKRQISEGASTADEQRWVSFKSVEYSSANVRNGGTRVRSKSG